jgi:hypothetical protein
MDGAKYKAKAIKNVQQHSTYSRLDLCNKVFKATPPGLGGGEFEQMFH